jgi:hypothetical protein
MIPEIGFIIGAYTITRLLSLAVREGDRAEHSSVKVLAVVAILVTGVMLYALAHTSYPMPNP